MSRAKAERIARFQERPASRELDADVTAIHDDTVHQDTLFEAYTAKFAT